MKKIYFLFITLLLLIAGTNHAKAVENTSNTLAKNAKSAILIEESTGEILYEFNSHEKLAPASMTKFITT